MKYVISALVMLLLLSACEEKVRLSEYNRLHQELEESIQTYEELCDEYSQLKEQLGDLGYSLKDSKEDYDELCQNVARARNMMNLLIDDYNKFVRGHWALRANHIADDAEDVAEALEGTIHLTKIRTRGGIRF